MGRTRLLYNLLLPLLALYLGFAECAEYYGKFIGNFKTQAHGVEGSVYAATNRTFFIKDFSYDGQGPDAYFWVGTTANPSPEGNRIPDERGTYEVLKSYDKKDIYVTLPAGVTIRDIRWLSVWCRKFSVNFGSVEIRPDLDLPREYNLGSLPTYAHGVRSGPVIIKNAKTIEIRDLYYDGAAPDAFFLVGKGSQPRSNGATKVPDETGSLQKLKRYRGDTVTLTLPGDMTIYDIEWLAIYCLSFEENFGNVVIPKDINVPAVLPPDVASLNPPLPADSNFHISRQRQQRSETYFGKLLGDFMNLAHGVEGRVYVASENAFYIKDFSYDGAGPDAHFWAGDTPDPSPNGFIVPDEFGRFGVLGSYNKKSILIKLPEGKTIRDIRWFSVWCRKFSVNFGHVLIPDNFEPPRELNIGSIPTFAHGTRSGPVTIKDMRTIHISNLYYDGAGPDAFFLAGKGQPNPSGRKIPDENGSLDKLHAYQGQSITLRLPEDMTFADIDWFGLYCIQFRENFGHVSIPKNLDVPADLQALASSSAELENCLELFPDRLQVRWKLVKDDVIIQLEGIAGDNEYFAFGLSGDQNTVKMVGGDVTVVFYDKETSKVEVQDYQLTAKSQCSVGNGVCPDTKLGGKNDAKLISWRRENGILKVVFQRPLSTGDSLDQSIPSSGRVSVIAAIGPLNSQKEAAFHTTFYLKDYTAIDFGQTSTVSNCQPFQTLDANQEPQVRAWDIQKISDTTTFRAQIGPAGGDRGYTAITGHQSWGIAWWINGLLIPEITVERGKNYTFIVEGGVDPTKSASYHPLYITNNAEGGGGQFLNQLGTPNHLVYAGVENDGRNWKPIGVGRYCEYKHQQYDKAAESETFEDYRRTLRLECEDGEPGQFTWTPDDNTPDLVYYQCFTHRNLGWKIHVTGDAKRLVVSHLVVYALLVFALLRLWDP